MIFNRAKNSLFFLAILGLTLGLASCSSNTTKEKQTHKTGSSEKDTFC